MRKYDPSKLVDTGIICQLSTDDFKTSVMSTINGTASTGEGVAYRSKERWRVSCGEQWYKYCRPWEGIYNPWCGRRERPNLEGLAYTIVRRSGSTQTFHFTIDDARWDWALSGYPSTQDVVAVIIIGPADNWEF